MATSKTTSTKTAAAKPAASTKPAAKAARAAKPAAKKAAAPAVTPAQKAGFPATPKNGNGNGAKAAQIAPATTPAPAPAAPPKRTRTAAKSALPTPNAETQLVTAVPVNTMSAQNHVNAALHQVAEGAPMDAAVLSQAAIAFGAAALSALSHQPHPPRTGGEVGGRRVSDHPATGNPPADDNTPGASTKGTKVQKERPMQNGVTRQSPGTVGDRLWSAFDAHRAKHNGEGNPTLVEARAAAKAMQLNETSASLALYQWRKFNGLGKAPSEQAAPVAPVQGK